jgi:hypothetical protein
LISGIVGAFGLDIAFKHWQRKVHGSRFIVKKSLEHLARHLWCLELNKNVLAMLK